MVHPGIPSSYTQKGNVNWLTYSLLNALYQPLISLTYHQTFLVFLMHVFPKESEDCNEYLLNDQILKFWNYILLSTAHGRKKMSGKLCCKETACKTCGYLKVSVKWKSGRKERLSSVNSSRCEQGSPRMAMAVRGDHGMEEVMLN